MGSGPLRWICLMITYLLKTHLRVYCRFTELISLLYLCNMPFPPPPPPQFHRWQYNMYRAVSSLNQKHHFCINWRLIRVSVATHRWVFKLTWYLKSVPYVGPCRRAKPKGSIWSLYKWPDTAFWLCSAARLSWWPLEGLNVKRHSQFAKWLPPDTWQSHPLVTV